MKQSPQVPSHMRLGDLTGSSNGVNTCVIFLLKVCLKQTGQLFIPIYIFIIIIKATPSCYNWKGIYEESSQHFLRRVTGLCIAIMILVYNVDDTS